MNLTLASIEAPPRSRSTTTPHFEVTLATPEDRHHIYQLRHRIYAAELGQHRVNETGQLTDDLDYVNDYLLVRVGADIAGFVSITPPSAPRFSIDKYFQRSVMPFPVDDRTYEVRLLSVHKPHRGSEVAVLLMYAAFRWVEARGGLRVVGIGRQEVIDLYLRSGLRGSGLIARSGAITYELMHAELDDLHQACANLTGLLDRLEERTDWQLPYGFRRPAPCFHGGAFFEAVGERFENLDRRHGIINADVLDAWFPPAPGALEALHKDLDWLLRTSPPTDCSGLVTTIAEARGVSPLNILPGAGSSDVIFRALRHWLNPRSHVLLLDPTYGEYAHVLERVIGCTVDRLTLGREHDFNVDLDALTAALRDAYDLVVLVNPNSPTGRHVPGPDLERVLRTAPVRTRIWVDETYVDFVGEGQSLEAFAARSANVIVCKSMSKAYALSGTRVAYLCAGAHQLEALRAITPPWVVGLPAQLAAVRALQDPSYYAARYCETARLRSELASGLEALGWKVLPGCANFLLCELPNRGPDAATLVHACRAEGLFLRDAALMGARLGSRFVRIAVKDAAANERMLGILRRNAYQACGVGTARHHYSAPAF